MANTIPIRTKKQEKASEKYYARSMNILLKQIKKKHKELQK